MDAISKGLIILTFMASLVMIAIFMSTLVICAKFDWNILSYAIFSFFLFILFKLIDESHDHTAD